MNIGEQILKYRKKEGLSQEELSNKVGVTRQTISKWELNETLPDLKQSIILSKLFNISIDEFINYERINKKDKNNKVVKTIIIIIIILIGIFMLYKIIYNKGVNDASISSNVFIECIKDNYKYNASISYWNISKTVYQVDGSKYILDNMNLDYHNYTVIEVINDINNYFNSNAGSCR